MKVGRLGMTVVASIAVGWGPPAVADSAGAPAPRHGDVRWEPGDHHRNRAGRCPTRHARPRRDRRPRWQRHADRSPGERPPLRRPRASTGCSGGPRRRPAYGGQRDWRHVTEEGSTERVGDAPHRRRRRRSTAAGPRPAFRRRGLPRQPSPGSPPSGPCAWTPASGIATGQGRDRFDSRDAWVVGSDARRHPRRQSCGATGSSADRGADRIRGDAWQRPDHHRSQRPGDCGRRWPSAVRATTRSAPVGGEDLLRGGPGDDLIDDFGPAADRLYGGTGPDMIFTQIVDAPGRRAGRRRRAGGARLRRPAHADHQPDHRAVHRRLGHGHRHGSSSPSDHPGGASPVAPRRARGPLGVGHDLDRRRHPRARTCLTASGSWGTVFLGRPR